MVLRGGDEAPIRDNVLSKAALPITAAVMFERFGYYTTVGSITVYFKQKMSLSSVRSTQMQSIQSAILYCFPIIGGILADVKLGRFNTSLIAAGTAIVGVILMCISSYPTLEERLDWLFLTSLLGVFSTGASCFLPPLIVLGGDQFVDSREMTPKRKLFFDLVYLATNIGAVVAFGLMAGIAVNGMGAITREYSFSFTFMVGGVCYIVAAAVLATFQKHIWVKACEGSALKVFVHITNAALANRKVKSGIVTIGGVVGIVISVVGSIIGYFWDNKAFQIILAILILVSGGILVSVGGKEYWVEDAFHSKNIDVYFSREEVVNVRDTYRALPFVALAIPFWAVYNQLNTNFLLQGCQMKSPATFFAPSTMNLFDSIGCIVFIVLINTFAIPLGMKLNWPLTNMRRIMIGLCIMCVSMAISCGVEVVRKNADISTTICTQEMADSSTPTCSIYEIGQTVKVYSTCVEYDEDTGTFPEVYQSEISIFILIPQFIAVSLSEVLVAPTYYDVFYAEVPPTLRTVCQTFTFFSISLGSLVGGVVNTLFSSWIPDDLNNGKLEYVYVVWVVLGVFTCVAQHLAARKFECKADKDLLEMFDKGTQDIESKERSNTNDNSELDYSSFESYEK